MASDDPWTEHDSALWITCEIASQLVRGGVINSPQRFGAPFPPRLEPGEEFWGGGGFEIARFFAHGDGSYTHHSGAFIGGGVFGLALGAGMAAGRAIGNAGRRRAAEHAATPRWHTVDSGELYVTCAGMYLRAHQGISSWSWFDVVMADMVGPQQMQFQPHGSEQLILRSDWAEMAFVLWALRRFPTHHQLLTGEWLPEGWLARAAARHPSSLTTPRLPQLMS